MEIQNRQQIRHILQRRDSKRLRELRELDINIERGMLGVSKKRANKLKRLQHRVRSEINKERKLIEEERESMMMAIRSKMVEVGFTPSKPNCRDCDGYGFRPPNMIRKCSSCKGTGQEEINLEKGVKR